MDDKKDMTIHTFDTNSISNLALEAVMQDIYADLHKIAVEEFGE